MQNENSFLNDWLYLVQSYLFIFNQLFSFRIEPFIIFRAQFIIKSSINSPNPNEIQFKGQNTKRPQVHLRPQSEPQNHSLPRTWLNVASGIVWLQVPHPENH